MRTKTKPITDKATDKAYKKDAVVVGYTFTDGDRFPMPVFSAELDTFRGKIYRTIEKAKLALQGGSR